MKIVEINKEYILDNISQEDIFSKFLNEHIEYGKKYFSPFRTNDSVPSCSFYWNKDKLRLKDFGSNFNGDCFDFVGRMVGLDSSNNKHFMIILHLIASYFRLEGYQVSDYEKKEDNIIHKVKKIVSFVPIDYDKFDKQYWKEINVDTYSLPQKFVYRAKIIWLNNLLIYTYNKANPAYVYVFSKYDIKIYFPFSMENKFITTSNKLQGLHLLTKSNFLVLTKSYKDVLSLSSFVCKGKYIVSLAVPSENYLLLEEAYEYLIKKYKFKVIFTLFDYDKTGLHCSWEHRKKYKTIPLFIKNDTWNSGVKYPIKDFSDYVRNNGINKTQKLIEKTYEKYSNLCE